MAGELTNLYIPVVGTVPDTKLVQQKSLKKRTILMVNEPSKRNTGLISVKDEERYRRPYVLK